ncbi:MAG: ADP-ribosylglycohydrolase family protein [Chloroflexota bacterium]|nr:ADP-ribosylglycohydrolase family protein [Chloroflexota bacterium]
MNDPNVVVDAPNVSAVLEGKVRCEEGLRDRARGVMLGLAVGNLLGLPMEGRSYREIDRWYPEGVRDIDPREVRRPMDDDLAQAVDLGEALLGGGDYVGEFGRRLVAWRRENGRGIGITTDRVIGVLEAGHRPPDAARIAYEGHPIAPNGGVMRCAPVALARIREPELLVRDSAATCVVTHYAPTSQWSCIVINAVIALLLKGIEPGLSALIAAASEDGCPDMLGAALRDGIPSDVLESIASGVPVEEECSWLRRDQKLIGHTLIALQAGLWAAVTPLGFEEALRQVVEAGGDTDTNGAVAGAVLGARYGASGIPKRWTDVVPERDRIEGVADGLLEPAE